MFDLSFYASVRGFVKFMQELMQTTLPNPEGYGRVGIVNYFDQKVESYHIIHDNFYFNFYMKTYFKYFNLNYPTTATKQFIMNRSVLEPEYFIYVRCINKKGNPQYEAFIKMLKADEEEFMDFLEKITNLP